MARGRNGRALTRIEGGKLTEGLGLRREIRAEEEDDWQPGPTYRRGEEGSECTGLGYKRWAAGWFLSLGRNVSPGPFSYFSFLCFFSFSVFLISLITFANMIQIKPNYFH
jgi:hypothetical protein